MGTLEGLLGLTAMAGAAAVVVRQLSGSPPSSSSSSSSSSSFWTSAGGHRALDIETTPAPLVIAARMNGYASTGGRLLELALLAPGSPMRIPVSTSVSAADITPGSTSVDALVSLLCAGERTGDQLSDEAAAAGVSANYLAQAPSFARMAPLIIRALADRRLVAWDGERLAATLTSEFIRAGIRPPSLQIDSLAQSAQGAQVAAFGRPSPNRRLSTLAAAHGCPPPDGTALGEARAVAALLPGRASRPFDADLVSAFNAVSLDRPLRPPAGGEAVGAPASDAPHPWLSYLFSTVPVSALETHDPAVASYVEDVVIALSRRTPAVGQVRGCSHRLLAAGYRSDQVASLHHRLLEGVRAAVVAQVSSEPGARPLTSGHVQLLRGVAAGLGRVEYVDDLVAAQDPQQPVATAGTAGGQRGSFAHPVRRPPRSAPTLPGLRCARCLGYGHQSPQCPRSSPA